MPRELKTKEEFTQQLENAVEVRVMKTGDSAKVKVRTKGTLFTFKTTAEEADSMTKGLKVPVVEL